MVLPLEDLGSLISWKVNKVHAKLYGRTANPLKPRTRSGDRSDLETQGKGGSKASAASGSPAQHAAIQKPRAPGRKLRRSGFVLQIRTPRPCRACRCVAMAQAWPINTGFGLFGMRLGQAELTSFARILARQCRPQ